jgi:predicted nucleic acid-binding protein
MNDARFFVDMNVLTHSLDMRSGKKPVEARQEVTVRARCWMDRAQVSYWDGLILASAEQAGCKYLLSEDFQAGRTYGEVTVVNPFQQSPAEFGLQTH